MKLICKGVSRFGCINDRKSGACTHCVPHEHTDMCGKETCYGVLVECEVYSNKVYGIDEVMEEE